MPDMDRKIIGLFKKNGNNFMSGEDLSRKLNVSRAAIWKHIENLRHIGYAIDAAPHLGYRLTGVPDKMIPEEIKESLAAKIFGKEIYSYAKVDSTNKLAYELAEKGAPEGTVILAEEQRKGRGRLGRGWASPPGGIYLSCIVRPDIVPSEIQEFTLVSALSSAKAIKKVTGLDILIKWPNDLLLKGKKICGILTEMKAESDKIDFLIIGIGVNANTPEHLLPDNAASLKAELGESVPRVMIVKEILADLEKEYSAFKVNGFEGIRDEVKALSATLGRRVKVMTHDKNYEGKALDIDEEGALVLRLESGIGKRILSGDTELLR